MQRNPNARRRLPRWTKIEVTARSFQMHYHCCLGGCPEWLAMASRTQKSPFQLVQCSATLAAKSPSANTSAALYAVPMAAAFSSGRGDVLASCSKFSYKMNGVFHHRFCMARQLAAVPDYTCTVFWTSATNETFSSTWSRQQHAPVDLPTSQCFGGPMDWRTAYA